MELKASEPTTTTTSESTTLIHNGIERYEQYQKLYVTLLKEVNPQWNWKWFIEWKLLSLQTT